MRHPTLLGILAFGSAICWASKGQELPGEFVKITCFESANQASGAEGSTGKSNYQKARDLADQVYTEAKTRKATALQQGNLVDWLHADNWQRMSSDYRNFQWIYDMDKKNADYSLADFIRDETGPELRSLAEKDALAIHGMQKTFQELPPDQIHYALKRIRDESGRSWKYRVLVQFPKNFSFASLPRSLTNVIGTQTESRTLYYEPQAACMAHACDDLFKLARDTTGGVGSLSLGDFQILAAITTAWKPDPAGVVEYADPETAAKKKSLEYVFSGILGVFSNERRIAAIPESLLKPL